MKTKSCDNPECNNRVKPNTQFCSTTCYRVEFWAKQLRDKGYTVIPPSAKRKEETVGQT